jgi:rubrerythrin
MNVYDYAMQMEKDGEAYYREGASRSAHKGLRSILTMLADAEVAHYKMFSLMKERKSWQVPDTPLLKDVKNVFIKMREEGDAEGLGVSEVDLYRKGQDIEKKTEAFYLEKAAQVEEGPEREAFLLVAGEENKHYFILQQIIDFVSSPDRWLESAEWYHLDEY